MMLLQTQLADNAVTTNKIADGVVTTEINNGAALITFLYV